MARHRFGADLTSWVFTDSGDHIPHLAAGIIITAWSDQGGGTQYTDLALDSAGLSPVTQVLTENGVDAPYGSIPQFWGPDGVWLMWLEAGDGPRLLAVTNDVAESTVLPNPHNTKLDDLTDVAIPTPNDGEAPVWQASTSLWKPTKVVPVSTISSTRTTSFTAVDRTFYRISLASGSVVATLPSASPSGQVITFQLTTTSGSNTFTVQRAGSDTINGGLTSFPLFSTNEAVTLISNSVGSWWVIAGLVDTPQHVGRGSSGNDAYLAMVNGDAVSRWNVAASGAMSWGAGSGARDTNLFRVSAGLLACEALAATVSGTPETMHTATLGNSWVTVGDLAAGAQYQLVTSPPNSLYVDIAVKNGTNTNGTTLFTLPAGWVPGHKHTVHPAVDIQTFGAGSPELIFNTSGAVTVNNCTVATQIFYTGVISLT